MSTKSNLRLVKPATEKRAVGPLRRPNSASTAGDSVTFTIHTVGVNAGTVETWALTGTHLAK